jgi:hypothetical protein
VPPLLLDDDEAVAIAVGLRTAAAGAVAGFEETSVRALAKVIQLLPPRLRRRIDALRAVTAPGVFGGGPTLDAAALTTIALACRGEERLRFGYAPRDGEPAARHVEPHRLVSLGRRWYLIAWDLDRTDWRSFRVDRLSGPTLTGARFRPRDIPGGDPVAWLRSRLAAIPSRYDVSVLIWAPAEQVRSLVGQWGTVEAVPPPASAPPLPSSSATPASAPPLPPSSATPTSPSSAPSSASASAPPSRTPAEACRLRMSVDDLSWPVMVLGVMRAPFTVESPPQLRDEVRSAGETLLRGVA